MEKPMHGSPIVPYIPHDVIEQILAKSSIKSLMKLKVVCKSWCSYISSDEFIKEYSSKVPTSPSRLIMNPFGLVNDLTFHHDLQDSIVVHESSIDFGIENPDYDVMGSCDGLVCVKECNHGTTILWNPSTRASKALPAGIFDEEKGRVLNRWKYGFGHECDSDDYKVVILSLEEKLVNKKNSYSYKTMMYSIRTDTWRRIGDSPTGYVFRDDCAAFVSGALHWVVDQLPRYTRLIMSLDLTSETYIEVPQPDYEYHSELAEIGASRGCLCLLACDNDEYYDIWVMNEYGVRESWTKSIKLPFRWGDRYCFYLKPLTWFIDEKGEIILSLGGNVASCNPDTNSVRYLSTENDDYIYRLPGYVFYVESLVSPNAYSRDNETRHLRINVVQEKLLVKDACGAGETILR